jgi:hypothetical protein
MATDQGDPCILTRGCEGEYYLLPRAVFESHQAPAEAAPEQLDALRYALPDGLLLSILPEDAAPYRVADEHQAELDALVNPEVTGYDALCGPGSNLIWVTPTPNNPGQWGFPPTGCSLVPIAPIGTPGGGRHSNPIGVGPHRLLLQ